MTDTHDQTITFTLAEVMRVAFALTACNDLASMMRWDQWHNADANNAYNKLDHATKLITRKLEEARTP